MIDRRRALRLGTAGVVASSAAVLAWRATDNESSEPAEPAPSAEAGTQAPATPSGSGERASTSGTPEITTTVSDTGFDIQLGPVRVSAPAGVAPEGTMVTVSTPDESIPEQVIQLTSTVEKPVVVTLENGLQPLEPVTIVFDLAGTDLARIASPETPLIAFSRSDVDESLLVMEGSWDAEQETLTVVTDHLSPFWPSWLDVKKFIDNLLQDLISVRFTKPAGAFRSLQLGGTRFSINQPSNEAVWPVMKERNGEFVLELHSNSPVPWQVRTRPAKLGTVSGEFKDMGPGIAQYYQGLYGLIGSQRTAVMPGNVATFRFPPSQPPTAVGLAIEPGLFLVSTLLWALESILSILATGEKAKLLLATFESFQCVAEVINTSHQIEDNQNFAGVVRSALACIGTLIEQNAVKFFGAFFVKTVVAVIGLVVGGAGIIAAAIAGVIYSVTGNDTLQFEITADAPSLTQAPVGPRVDQPIVVKWTFDEPGVIYHAPVIHEGKVYLANQVTFHLLDTATGHQDWMFSAIEEIDTPVISGNLVFLNSGYRSTGVLHALDTQAQLELWNFKARTINITSPIVVGETVYFGSEGTTRAVEATTGNMIWNLPHARKWSSSMLVSEGMLYATLSNEINTGPASLHAIDPATGLEQWTVDFAERLATPVIADGIIYVTDMNGQLAAIDARTGELKWEYRVEGPAFLSTIDKDVLYMATGQGTLYAVDATTGIEMWRHKAPGEVTPLKVAASQVFFTSGPTLYALSIERGTASWQFSSGMENVLSDYAVADGMVYLTGKNLYALDADTGEELWRYGLSFDTIGSPRISVGEGVIVLNYTRSNVAALGNLRPTTLTSDVTLRGAPSNSAVSRGSAKAGNTIDRVGAQDRRTGTAWVEVTIGSATGWIPLDAIDPATLPPEGEIEYVYVPE